MKAKQYTNSMLHDPIWRRMPKRRRIGFYKTWGWSDAFIRHRLKITRHQLSSYKAAETRAGKLFRAQWKEFLKSIDYKAGVRT